MYGELTERMIAYVQQLMFAADRMGGRVGRTSPFFKNLERIETYLIRRFNRGVF